MGTDKKILLYEAALGLIEEKRDMSNIKVADIAKAADIGKGTVYEYFKSKEQLLAESIIYFLKKCIKTFEESINSGGGFKVIYMAALKNISSTMTASRTFSQYITFNECNFSIKKAMQSLIEEHFENMRRAYVEKFEKIIDIGVKEGVLKKKPDKFSWLIAFGNSIMCIVAFKHGFEEFVDMTEEEMMERSYNMFVKVLT